MFAQQPSEAAAKCQPGDPRRRDYAACAREPVDLRLAVVFAPGDAALRARRVRSWIDMDAFHERQIDHDSAVERRTAGNVMAATPHRDLDTMLAREVHSIDDVCHALAARNQERPFVDQAVVDAPRVLVPGIGWLEQLSAESRCDLRQRVGNRDIRHDISLLEGVKYINADSRDVAIIDRQPSRRGPSKRAHREAESIEQAHQHIGKGGSYFPGYPRA